MKTLDKKLALMTGLFLFLGCTPVGQHGNLPPLSNAAQLKQGQRLYAAHCASCHGVQAHGGSVGPDLTASSFRYGKQRDKVVQSILEGRPGGMPAFNAHLGLEQATYLTDFLLQPQ